MTRKIIMDLKYDTESAVKIGSVEVEPQAGFSCLTAWRATLYKTPRAGRYFLLGSGGPMTRFSNDKNWDLWGDKLIRINESQAFKWALCYLASTTVNAHFQHLLSDNWRKDT